MRCDPCSHDPSICALVTRVVVCPDKFRGSLRAAEVAAAMAAGVARAGFDEVVELPLADGGEGTLDTLLGGGDRGARPRDGPARRPGRRGVACPDRRPAVIEMAQASGLALVSRTERSPRATTHGTGELIAAVGRGLQSVLIAVGGSATTDGGRGGSDGLVVGA